MTRQDSVTFSFAFSHPAHVISTVFGAGTVPVASGTLGSMLAVLPYFLLFRQAIWVQIIIFGLVLVLSVISADFTSRALNGSDHSSIIIDEVAGMLAVLLLLPAHTVPMVILGFMFFRWFDIVKPWYIGVIDRNFSGGIGIVLDDFAAALFALTAVYACHGLYLLIRQ